MQNFPPQNDSLASSQAFGNLGHGQRYNDPFRGGNIYIDDVDEEDEEEAATHKIRTSEPYEAKPPEVKPRP